jgi:hypothetical protein
VIPATNPWEKPRFIDWEKTKALTDPEDGGDKTEKNSHQEKHEGN